MLSWVLALPGFIFLSFLQEFGFQHHYGPLYPAFNFFFVARKADIFYHSTSFNGRRGAFYFQIFDYRYRVAFVQEVAIAVFYFHGFVLGFRLSGLQKIAADFATVDWFNLIIRQVFKTGMAKINKNLPERG